jgi:hypothetical protein
MKQVPLTLEFLDHIEPAWGQSREFAKKVVVKGRTEYSEAWEDEDGPLVAWGIIELWEGVGTIWIVLDVRAPKRLRPILRAAKDGLERAEKIFGRLQGEFHEQAPTWKFARHLGFEIEGCLKNYGIGAVGDYYMCARIHNA